MFTRKFNSRGFTDVLILLAVVIVITVGVVAWSVSRAKKPPLTAVDTSTNTNIPKQVVANNTVDSIAPASKKPVANSDTKTSQCGSASTEKNILKMCDNLQLSYPENWAQEAAGVSFDYALVGDTNYKILVEILQGNESSPDSCAGCRTTVIDNNFVLGSAHLFIIATSEQRAPSTNAGDQPNGSPSYTYPPRTSVRLSACADSFCPPTIPGSSDKIHYALYYFVEGGIPDNLDVSTIRSKTAIEVFKNLVLVQ